MNLDPSTWRTRGSVHWHLLRFFGDASLDEIDATVIDAFSQHRLEEGVVSSDEKAAQKRKPRPLSKAGLAEQLKVLRAILRWAVARVHLQAMTHVEDSRLQGGGGSFNRALRGAGTPFRRAPSSPSACTPPRVAV